VDLQDSVLPERSSLLVSELSHLQHVIKEDTHAKKKPCGHQHKNDPQLAKYTNWFDPFIWVQIKMSAERVGLQMSPLEIVWDLQKCSPGTFDKLYPQTLSKWIDSLGMTSCWKDSTPWKAGKGNYPGGDNTRRGALVSSVATLRLSVVDNAIDSLSSHHHLYPFAAHVSQSWQHCTTPPFMPKPNDCTDSTFHP
jgi:hypothetical protein